MTSDGSSLGLGVVVGAQLGTSDGSSLGLGVVVVGARSFSLGDSPNDLIRRPLGEL